MSAERLAEIRERWGAGGYRPIPASWEDEARELVERGSEDAGYLMAEVERLQGAIERALASLDDPSVTWIAAREILVEAVYDPMVDDDEQEAAP